MERRTVRAFVLAPLVAPVGYWVAAGVTALFDDARRIAFFRSALPSLGFVLAFGAPVAYAAAFAVVLPSYLTLGRRNWRPTWLLVVLGAIAGGLTAILLRPSLRGEIVSVPLTPTEGAALGVAAAGAFAWLVHRPEPPTS